MVTLLDIVNIVQQNLLDFEAEKQEIEGQIEELEELLEESKEAAEENFSTLVDAGESLLEEIEEIANEAAEEVEEMMASLNNLEAKIDNFLQEIQNLGKQRKEDTINLIQKMATTSEKINSYLEKLQEAVTDFNQTVDEVKPSLENHFNNLTQFLTETLLPAVENCQEEVDSIQEGLEEICQERILNFLDSQEGEITQELAAMADTIQNSTEEYLESIKETTNFLLQFYGDNSNQLQDKYQEIFAAIAEDLISLLETNRINISQEGKQWQQIGEFVLERYEEITENSQYLVAIFERLIDR
ncbi:MAG: apolipoprotein A1/A4/E family protein [Geminocystis sp.]|nr:apolipoprotein A1/A4/E family protein [Geminocystis sp.]HIK37406.1 hypothetical protein [Geminocystis sp. M7585_C2015_104]MCS7146902.1 apolipoprotein A1/A4/E family protein [Geminocystis sp.]MCX8078921.1 apolipoprotein A1/A4/E family protein [Geminocystis sp.]MDW8115726.1 hypothetical protein [Geminocystis sp.]